MAVRGEKPRQGNPYIPCFVDHFDDRHMEEDPRTRESGNEGCTRVYIRRDGSKSSELKNPSRMPNRCTYQVCLNQEPHASCRKDGLDRCAAASDMIGKDKRENKA